MQYKVRPGQSVFKWAEDRYYGPGEIVDLSNLGPKMLQQFINRGVVEPIAEPEEDNRGEDNQPEDNEQ